MIFVKPKFMATIFSQAMLDAINAYAYFKSHSLKDLLDGISCNVHEFGVNDVMLRLAVYLNYTDADSLSHDSLNAFLDEMKSFMADEPVVHDEYSKGIYLLYLILSERGEAFVEAISVEKTQLALDNVKFFISDLSDEVGIIINQ